jgi:hypothetical protein
MLLRCKGWKPKFSVLNAESLMGATMRCRQLEPRILDPPPPTLELFDLDECFMDVRVHLAQLTDQCSSHSELESLPRRGRMGSWVGCQKCGWRIAKTPKYYISSRLSYANYFIRIEIVK